MITTTRYSIAYLFTKHTNLLQWFDTKYHRELEKHSLGFDQLRQSYATPRDVQLILLVRYEDNKVYCKIKCPINPLPICGEFEAPSVTNVIQFLQKENWVQQQKLPVSLFK